VSPKQSDPGGMEGLRRHLSEAARQLADRPGVRRLVEKVARGLRDGRREEALSRQLQEGLLPSRLPAVEGLAVAARLIHAPGGGTDLYDVFELAEGFVGFFVAEVRSGGFPGAPLLATTKVALDAARMQFHSPAAILDEVNADLVHRGTEGRFLTAFLGVLDVRTLHLRYVNAAHPAPLRRSGRRTRSLRGKGRCLGRFEDPDYREIEVQLDPGERLVLYSSGLTQARDRSGAAYSAADEMAPENLVDRLLQDVERHVGTASLRRDISVVAVSLAKDIVLDTKIVIRSEPDQLTRPVNAIMARLQELNYDERTQFAIRLCIEEALINALKHGNRMDRTKRITTTFRADEHGLRISVEDEGNGFHPDAVPDPRLPENLEVSHGRGLLLMRSYMDEVSFSNKGRKVTLVKKAPWE